MIYEIKTSKKKDILHEPIIIYCEIKDLTLAQKEQDGFFNNTINGYISRKLEGLGYDSIFSCPNAWHSKDIEIFRKEENFKGKLIHL